VVVAQSLSGFVGPLVADRLPVRELVLLAAMVPRPGESAGEWWGATGHVFPAPFDPLEVFLHDAPAEVLADAEAHAVEQSDRVMQDPWPLAGAVAGGSGARPPFHRAGGRPRRPLRSTQLPGRTRRNDRLSVASKSYCDSRATLTVLLGPRNSLTKREAGWRRRPRRPPSASVTAAPSVPFDEAVFRAPNTLSVVSKTYYDSRATISQTTCR
jgi:hypothetical protein